MVGEHGRQAVHATKARVLRSVGVVSHVALTVVHKTSHTRCAATKAGCLCSVGACHAWLVSDVMLVLALFAILSEHERAGERNSLTSRKDAKHAKETSVGKQLNVADKCCNTSCARYKGADLA